MPGVQGKERGGGLKAQDPRIAREVPCKALEGLIRQFKGLIRPLRTL